MRNATLAACLLLMTAGLGGCLSDDASLSSAPDAPLSPRQLRVGSTLLGEYIRIAVNSSGHQLHFEDRQIVARAFEDHDYLERRIVEAVGRDRYWQEFDAIQFQNRLTDLDPAEGETAVFTQQTTYRKADRQTVYLDIQTSYENSYTTCNQVQGCTTQRSTEPVDFRLYDLNPSPVEALSLAGKVLTLGKVTSLNYTWTDRSGRVHGEWANYTAKKEATINGERSFLVEVKFESKILNRKGEEKPMVGPAASSGAPRTPTASPEEKEDKRQPVRQLYYGSRHSMPVKQVLNFPWEHDGVPYWYNTTTIVETYEAGQTPITWGNAPSANDTSTTKANIPFKELRANLGFKDLTYPFTAAWKNLAADPTLTEFQRVRAAAPDVVPMSLSYYPDTARNAYTWQVSLGDDAGNGVRAESRLQGPPGAPVYLTQDKESGFRFSGRKPVSADTVGSTLFVKGDDLYTLFRQVRPGSWQPGVSFDLYQYGDDAKSWGATATFTNPATARSLFAATPLHGEYLIGRDTISLSPRDGGLLAINNTWWVHYNDWPMRPPFGTPIPPQQQEFLDESRRIAEIQGHL